MIEAGEDPRFIARRIMISAAEDVGMADPQALPIAVAAAEGVQLIGMPEGRILLAEAVVYLAMAPKSNAAYVALDAAIADVRAGKTGGCRRTCATRTTPGAKRLGHGKGYQYAHDADSASPRSSTCPTNWSALSTTTRPASATNGMWRHGWRRSARFCAGDQATGPRRALGGSLP